MHKPGFQGKVELGEVAGAPDFRVEKRMKNCEPLSADPFQLLAVTGSLSLCVFRVQRNSHLCLSLFCCAGNSREKMVQLGENGSAVKESQNRAWTASRLVGS